MRILASNRIELHALNRPCEYAQGAGHAATHRFPADHRSALMVVLGVLAGAGAAKSRPWSLGGTRNPHLRHRRPDLHCEPQPECRGWWRVYARKSLKPSVYRERDREKLLTGILAAGALFAGASSRRLRRRDHRSLRRLPPRSKRPLKDWSATSRPNWRNSPTTCFLATCGRGLNFLPGIAV